MRQDNIVGLTSAALELIKNRITETVLLYTEQTIRIYPNGLKETLPLKPIMEASYKKEEYSSYHGMFDTEYPLFKYIFSDGTVLFEAVQEEAWSSGACFFLALKNEKGEWVKESLWLEDDIKSYL